MRVPAAERTLQLELPEGDALEFRVRIRVIEPGPYLPVIAPVTREPGRATQIDLSSKALVAATPLVSVPAGTLHRGVRDDTVSARLLADYYALVALEDSSRTLWASGLVASASTAWPWGGGPCRDWSGSYCLPRSRCRHSVGSSSS